MNMNINFTYIYGYILLLSHSPLQLSEWFIMKAKGISYYERKHLQAGWWSKYMATDSLHTFLKKMEAFRPISVRHPLGNGDSFNTKDKALSEQMTYQRYLRRTSSKMVLQ